MNTGAERAASALSRDAHAYLARIRFALPDGMETPEPSLASLRALQMAHLLAAPFENLSIAYGQPITLDEQALYDKIVRRNRGGFCYELNGLFAWLLRTLGFTVDLLSAGVGQGDGAFTPEYDHLTLRVRDLDGSDWLSDVGFGDSFRQPLRLTPDVEQDGGDGHRYRLRVDGDGAWTLDQSATPDWRPQYRFTLRAHALDDFRDRCVWQQTSPDSHFVKQRLCTLALPDGRVTLSDLRLITTLHGQREERPLASEQEFLATLAERFAIVL